MIFRRNWPTCWTIFAVACRTTAQTPPPSLVCLPSHSRQQIPVHAYSIVRQRKECTKLIAKHSVTVMKIEWMVDFLVVDQESATKRIPLIACESEMHPNHGCGYSFDPYDKDPKYHKDDYVWDFCKLLHFNAPYLLFIARLSDRNFVTLEESLNQCAREYRELWQNSRLRIVLLPTAIRRRRQIQPGEGKPDGKIAFGSPGCVSFSSVVLFPHIDRRSTFPDGNVPALRWLHPLPR